MEKKQTYRASVERHIMTMPENSKANKISNARWRNRMCDYCFQRAVIIYNGCLYCTDCAEREGIKDGQGKDC